MYEKVHSYFAVVFTCRPLCNQWHCGFPFEPTSYDFFLKQDDPRWAILYPDKWCGKCFIYSRLQSLPVSYVFVPRIDALLADGSEVSSVASEDPSDE